MTLRSIELQVAIPRTSEVGQIQNQLAQKPAYDQNQLAQQSAKKADEQLKKSNEIDQAFELQIRDEEQKQGGGRNDQKRERKKDEQAEPGQTVSVHPYKGRHIDLTL